MLQETAERLTPCSLKDIVQDAPSQLSMKPPSVLSCPTAKHLAAPGHDTPLNETSSPDDCGFGTTDHAEPSHSSITPPALEWPPDGRELSPTAIQNVSEKQDTLLSWRAPPGSTRGALLQEPLLKISASSSYWLDDSATQYVGSAHEMASTSPNPSWPGAPSRLHVPAPVAAWAGDSSKERGPRTRAIAHANPKRTRHEDDIPPRLRVPIRLFLAVTELCHPG